MAESKPVKETTTEPLQLHELSFKQLCNLKYETNKAQQITLKQLIAERKKEFEQVLDIIQTQIDHKSRQGAKKAIKKFKGTTLKKLS